MSSTQSAPSSVIDPKTENPKTLRWAGAILFVLGLLALVVSFNSPEVNTRINMGLYAALFLALGYPLVLYAGALAKIAKLEQRLRDLEGGPKA